MVSLKRGSLALGIAALIVYLGCFSFYRQYESVLTANVSDSLNLSGSSGSHRPNPGPAALFFTGDVMLSRAVGEISEKNNNPDFPFAKASSTLRSADFVFGNLESPISDLGENEGSIYSFRAATSSAGALSRAGFKVMSVANNHIWDYGSPSLLQTVSLLKQNSILPVGAGENARAANRPARININGNRIVFLAFTNLYPESLIASTSTPGVSRYDLDRISETIKKIRPTADLIVISLHWGEEYSQEASPWQKEAAHKLIDAGADLIVGHHPHVVEELEQYNKGWIAYSLGNFVFDQTFSEATKNGALLKIALQDGKILSCVELPFTINNSYQPVLAK